MKKKLELYIHIPFCERKCNYCDFLSSPAGGGMKREYVEALTEELIQKAGEYQSYSVPSLYFGGGTPSVLSGESILKIMEILGREFQLDSDAEITIECNPGTLTEEKLGSWRRAGVNRISLGLQSARDEELRLLGRIHTWDRFLESYDLARRAGFDNLNVDLMYALPHQTAEQWEYSLDAVTALRPEHISAYGLIVEEGTPFYKSYGEEENRRREGEETDALPGEEEENAMYRFAGAYLAKRGYRQYEISNYARPGFACSHNIGYWTRENYLGLGLGSASLVENERFSNTRDLNAYLRHEFGKKDVVRLNEQAQMEEFMFLGLRLIKGVSVERFRECFGVELLAVYGKELSRLCGQKLLEQKDGRVRLTPEGILVSNYVMSQFLK